MQWRENVGVENMSAPTVDKNDGRESVSSHIQTQRSLLKKRGVVKFFKRISKYLDMWWNTLSSVWFSFSNKSVFYLSASVWSHIQIPVDRYWFPLCFCCVLFYFVLFCFVFIQFQRRFKIVSHNGPTLIEFEKRLDWMHRLFLKSAYS